MVRILTIVSVLALLAGLSIGFFVSEARATARVASSPAIDPVLERKVDDYVTRYGLDAASTQEIRAALKDYDQGLLDLLRQLRQRHKDDFKALSDRANARIDQALQGRPR
jgi:uncharacterized protein YneF (UPF0154 family)